MILDSLFVQTELLDPAMPARKPEPLPEADNPEQYRRFIDMAREIEADETPGAMDRAFEEVIPSPPSRKVPKSPADQRRQPIAYASRSYPKHTQEPSFLLGRAQARKRTNPLTEVAERQPFLQNAPYQ